MNGEAAFAKLMADYEFQTVLDLGCGLGTAAIRFGKAGKSVSAINLTARSDYLEKAIVANYMTTQFAAHDLVWCSHVLEHQLNPYSFLNKIHWQQQPGQILALVVPGKRRDVVNGHVILWNAGTLLYFLAVSGFDCSRANVLHDSQDLSIICRRAPGPRYLHEVTPVPPIDQVAHLMPEPCRESGFSDEIQRWNW